MRCRNNQQNGHCCSTRVGGSHNLQSRRHTSSPPAAQLALPRVQIPKLERGIRTRGILDSYRRSIGESVDEKSGPTAEKQESLASHAYPGNELFLTFDSLDEDTCPATCVKEVFTAKEFKQECEAARDSLVVVDFFKTSCGACKYIQTGFMKICKASYEGEHPEVIFLKHNVYDDEEGEKSDLARRLRIANVPTFMFYRRMELLEEFATRDRVRLEQAIQFHTSSSPENASSS